jgi:hypothetical protein
MANVSVRGLVTSHALLNFLVVLGRKRERSAAEPHRIDGEIEWRESLRVF